MKRIIAWIMVTMLVLSSSAVADVSKGAKGDEVKEIQQILADLGYLTGKVDGDFGGGTEKAVKAFQAAEGIEETGVVDDKTMEKLHQKQEEQAEAKRLEEANKMPDALQANFDGIVSVLQESEVTQNIQPFKTPDNLCVVAFTQSFPNGVVGTSLWICPPAEWVSVDESGSGLNLLAANYETVSWTEERSFYDYLREFKDAGDNVEKGVTSFTHLNGTLVTDTTALYYLSIDLPNDSSIAGDQSITVGDATHTRAITLELNLEYLGDGNGWSVAFLGSREALPEERFDWSE